MTEYNINMKNARKTVKMAFNHKIHMYEILISRHSPTSSRHYPTCPDIPRPSPDRREKSGNVGSPCGGGPSVWTIYLFEHTMHTSIYLIEMIFV